MLQPPSIAPLVPQQHTLPNGNRLHFFPNNNLGLVKLDITVEAGSRYQHLKCLAHAANQLIGEATTSHDARQMAEILDFRGIVVERMIDVCVGNVSFYFLRRYAEDLFPLIREMYDAPIVTQPMFDAYVAKRRQQLATGFQKTSYVARNRFYEELYGLDHPLGTYAMPDDIDALTPDAVTDYIHQHYRLANAHMVLSGMVDDELLSLADRHLAPSHTHSRNQALTQSINPEEPPLPPPHSHNQALTQSSIPNAVQSTIRIGRILPLAWDSPDYARFMVLNTVLGGYFGSRLMSNIREDKGYTYGIYSTTQIYRGSIVFYITADVAVEATQAAVDEVYKEIDRLRQEPISEEELERVRNYMMGDFIRSIDGVFELSERYRQMAATHVTEQLTTNLLDAIENVTPEQLQTLAQTHLTDLLTVTVGPSA